MSDFAGFDGFVWFLGIVEDIDDPLYLGRARVRINNVHSQNKSEVPTDRLPWATPVQPITSPAIEEKGTSPTGLLVGSTVVGFFADGANAQYPLIFGTFAANPTYPTSNQDHEVNKLARNEQNYPHPVLETKESGRTRNVPTALDGSWSEPESPYNAVYPNNHVKETTSGHIVEFDDSEGDERIHEYHTAGTFYEIDKDGNKVTRVVGNNYTIVAGTDFVNVKGNVNLTIDQDCKTYVKGDWDVQVDGNWNLNVAGRKNEIVRQKVTEQYGSSQQTIVSGILDVDAGLMDFDAGRIDLN